ncbi:MAG TPA: hypothetical protein VLE89_05030 [Chlamydiales bacterium]|nr:hypothetical protein [Chlamydiales bacterium]
MAVHIYHTPVLQNVVGEAEVCSRCYKPYDDNQCTHDEVGNIASRIHPICLTCLRNLNPLKCPTCGATFSIEVNPAPIPRPQPPMQLPNGCLARFKRRLFYCLPPLLGVGIGFLIGIVSKSEIGIGTGKEAGAGAAAGLVVGVAGSLVIWRIFRVFAEEEAAAELEMPPV